MSLDNASIVDAIGVEKKSGHAILTILDSWDWSDEQAHLVALQNKINSYFRFIESGEIWTSYAGAVGRKLVIEVVTRFPLTKVGEDFLEKASVTAGELDVSFRHRVSITSP